MISIQTSINVHSLMVWGSGIENIFKILIWINILIQITYVIEFNCKMFLIEMKLMDFSVEVIQYVYNKLLICLHM